MMTTLSVPLFPLNTVLFPGGPLPLRIFEPRYLEMVSHCLKTESPFGVCLIQSGREAGQAAEPHRIGTLTWIVDWNKLPDGMLGITARGGDRFSIESTAVAGNQLLNGAVTLLPEPPTSELPGNLRMLPRLLEQIIPEAGALYESIEPNYEDSNWIGYRLAEILPFDPPARQRLLEQQDSLQRLYDIHASLEQFLEQNSQP